MRKRQRQWLGTAVIAVVLVFLFWRTSQSSDWRQFSWPGVWSLLIHANRLWLAAAVVFTYASYLIRAYRWKFFIDPFKPSSLSVLFTGQILGFSAVYLIGRPGELVRPAYIARWEDVPFASQLAILVLERLYDLVASATLFGLALYFEPVHSRGAAVGHTLHRMHLAAAILLAGTLAMVALLAVYRFHAESIIRWAAARLRFLPAGMRRMLGNVARSFAEGLDVIRNWKDLTASVVCTALLWVVNVSVFWFVYQSLGGALADLSWWAAAVSSFCAGVGLVIQLPGVGGGFQLAILFALKQLFQIPPGSATSAALLLWLVILVPCVLLSGILLIYGGLSFKKLKAMADEEAARRSRVEPA
jgi:glycosyltransferase 2 family protein